jgi:GAF domain-containing protein
MGRGPKPAKGKAKPLVGSKSPKDNAASVRDLEKRLAEALGDKAEAQEQLRTRDREFVEAQDQQTATSEILKVISRSPSDVQPVFDMIAESAARLCDAIDVTIFRVDADVLRVVVHKGPIPSTSVGQARPMVRGTPAGRAVLERRTIHVADVQAEIDEYPEGSASARHLGHRTTLVAPLLHVGDAIGAIVVRRTDVRPFTDRQVDLLQTFADQAVIAIENVRLFNETKEALEQQTATSEILRVISSSPTELGPVLDAVAENAARVCEAGDIGVFQLDGDTLRVSARHGTGPKQDIGSVARIRRDLLLGRTLLERRTIHVRDMAVELDSEYPGMRSTVERFGMRTMLCTPLLSGGKAIGVIVAVRYEVRPFVDKHIRLLETFADQAVIAIQNVRLFNVRLFKELQQKNDALTQAYAQVSEALERQTATGEILRVISSSPTDAQPVFEAIARSAVRLCRGIHGGVLRLSNDLLSVVALENLSETAADVLLSAYPLSPDRAGLVGLAIRSPLSSRNIRMFLQPPHTRWG